MRSIRTQTLYDDAKHPVAVQIPYADWLEVEAQLRLADVQGATGGAQPFRPGATAAALAKYAGVLSLSEDPLEYQTRIREEWP